ncbi:arylesterase [Paludibaculum fermentans]|uniref:Arylesterase n=1 Tax=Paludibaculum fermentans TaxID=1473598 RepID=A0A7S7SJG5_PALFE|nr:arylesterase [Paludibaculum fermentans]QOY85975.1 arylesterase [Paludibaculum fermentans]
MRFHWRIYWVAVVLCVAACSKPEAKPEPAAGPAPAAAAQPAAQPVETDTRPVIVAFGDSLTAGYGLEPGLSYADFLQKQLDAKGYRYRVVNQGISGDTTDGGVTRVAEALRLKPAVVILELGANDGLRGLPVESTGANLTEMVDSFQKAGAKVVLCGMTLPRNYGQDYIRNFEKVFQELTRTRKLTTIPFFLDGVATRPELMQRDGMHPTAKGTEKVAGTVMKYLEPLLRK